MQNNIDILYEAAKFFHDNLEGKQFHLIAGKRGNLLEFDIVFNAKHFKHLIGFHKLYDIPMSDRSSEVIYHQILDKKTDYSDIENSCYIKEMEDRLKVFNRIKDLLFSPNVMLKSSKGFFRTIRADFLLSKTDDLLGNIHLFLKGDKEGIVFPVSYFTDNTNAFFVLGYAKWKVLSVREIVKVEDKDDNKK